MRLIFMGTPAFAVPTLQALISSKHQVIAVYTKPPQPAGRGQQESISPIHILALEHGITVYTPKSLRHKEEAMKMANLKPDIAVVAAYGLILPQSILDIPPNGCINIHPSSLPRWRGAAPLQWTILSGDTNSTMCIMRMDAGMDTGDIILRQEVELPDTINIKELHDQMAQLGAEMVLQALQQIESGTATYTPQDAEGATHATKLTRQHERLQFNQPIHLVHAQVRAFSPRPGAYFEYHGEIVKVISANYTIDESITAPAGTVLDNDLSIAAIGGILHPTLLQRQGRKMIYTDAFLRGFPIPAGSFLS